MYFSSPYHSAGPSTSTRLSRFSASVGVVTTGISMLAVVDAFLNHRVLPIYPSGAIPPPLVATIVAATFALTLFLLSWKPASPMVRRVSVVAMAGVFFTILLCIVSRSLTTIPVFLEPFRAVRPLAILGLSLIASSLMCHALGHSRLLGGVFGLAVFTMGVFSFLGNVYGLLMLSMSPARTAIASVFYLLLGTGLITAAGEDGWPVRIMLGPSVRAKMIRWLVPLVAAIVIVTDIATNLFFKHLPPAVGSALNTIVSISGAGIVIYWLGRIIDNRLQLSAAALRRSEEKFSRVFRAVPAGLAVTKAGDGQFIDVNDEFERICGYSREEAIGRSAEELGLWANVTARREFVDQVADAGGELRDVELVLRAKDGRSVLIRTASQLLDVQGERFLISSFVDVTERKNAEEALRLSQLQLSTIFRESPIALAVAHGHSGRLLEVNPAYLRQMGATSVDQVLGKTVVELGLLTEETRDGIREARLNGSTQNLIVPSRTLDGRSSISEVSFATYDVDGVPYLLTSVLDITQRLRAEHEANTELIERRRTQRRLDLALEAASIFIWEFDPQTRRFWADTRLLDLYQLVPESDGSISYEEWESRVEPDDRPVARKLIEYLAAGGAEVEAEFLVQRPDGSRRYIHGAATLLPAEGSQPARVVGLNIDITSQKLAEIELRKHQDDLETLVATRTRELERANFLSTTALELSKAGYWHVPLDGSGYWNSSERLVEMYGDPPMPNSRYSLDFWATQVRAADEQAAEVALENFAAACEGKIPRYDATYAYKRPADGNIVWLRAIGNVVTDANGRPTDMYGVSTDVTDFRNLERILRASRDEAESSSRAKGTFLAHMSHEIRTPMNAILGYAQLLGRDAALNNEQRRKIEAIRSSGDHLLNLLNDILEMSRIEAGRVILSREPFDLYDLIDGVRSMFTELMSRRGLVFDVQLAPNLARALTGDAGKVRQVIINLLGNAKKFTQQGNITLRVSSRRMELEQCEVSVEVQDTGLGIEASDIEGIFLAFQQSDAGRHKGGTGLGLPISRSFARLMGGDITVRSTPGEGSTFTFTFMSEIVPESRLVTVLPQVGMRRLDSSESNRKALVVDDVTSNRELLEETLTRAGFLTRSVDSGERALVAHAEWRPHFILMDLHMPGMGGLAAIRTLRRQQVTTPIIVTTAGAEESTARDAALAGANGFLRKPYRDAELFDMITRAAGIRLVAAPTPMSNVAVNDPQRESAELRELLRPLPSDLLADIREACRQVRASRLLQLADRVAMHSEPAAAGLRNAANAFRYATVLAALEGER